MSICTISSCCIESEPSLHVSNGFQMVSKYMRSGMRTSQFRQKYTFYILCVEHYQSSYYIWMIYSFFVTSAYFIDFFFRILLHFRCCCCCCFFFWKFIPLLLFLYFCCFSHFSHLLCVFRVLVDVCLQIFVQYIVHIFEYTFLPFSCFFQSRYTSQCFSDIFHLTDWSFGEWRFQDILLACCFSMQNWKVYLALVDSNLWKLICNLFWCILQQELKFLEEI